MYDVSDCRLLCNYEIYRRRYVFLGLAINPFVHLLLTGLAFAMNTEIQPFGLRSLLFEPGFFDTKIVENRKVYESRIPEYEALTLLLLKVSALFHITPSCQHALCLLHGSTDVFECIALFAEPS